MNSEFFGTEPRSATTRSRQLFERELLVPQDLMQVVLVVQEKRLLSRSTVPSFTRAELPDLVAQLKDCGIRQIKLFASESMKGDPRKLAVGPDNALVNALKAVKDLDDQLYVAVETCLCPYTVTGACGIYHDKAHSWWNSAMQFLRKWLCITQDRVLTLLDQPR
jgi:porphobilinogen synthase